MNRYAVKLGFWSSTLAAASFLLFTVCFVAIVIANPLFTWTNLADYVTYVQRYDQTWAYIARACALLFGPFYLLILHSVYEIVPAEQKILVRIAISFGILFVGLTGLHYFVQLSTVRLSLARGELQGLEQFLQAKPDSAIAAINMLGWTLFFGLSSFFVAPVFGGGRLQNSIRRLFYANALFCFLAGIGFVFDIVILVFLTIDLGMGAAVTAATILLGLYFRRLQSI